MNWSECEARCWFTYADAVEGRKYTCKIIGYPIPVDADMVKIVVNPTGESATGTKELFADRTEINVNGSWRTVLDVWQEENTPTDPAQAHVDTHYHQIIRNQGRPCATDGCDRVIYPTGKRGRPATRCNACRGVA